MHPSTDYNEWHVLLLAIVLSSAVVAGMNFIPGGGYDPDRGIGQFQSGNNSLESAENKMFREVSTEEFVDYKSDRKIFAALGWQGVYVSDYDDNGFTDILLIGGEKPILYENEKGNFWKSGEIERDYPLARSAHFFDYDSDGDDDLLLLRKGKTPVMYENVKGKLTEKKNVFETPLSNPLGATSADYNQDGCIDLFVYQTGQASANTAYLPAEMNKLQEDIRTDISEFPGGSNILFKGDCGSFQKVSHRANITGEAWSLAASFVDLNDDSSPDIHVANDFSRDVIYLNNGNGTFSREKMGYASRRDAMSSEIALLNNDALPDIFVSNIHAPDRYAHGEGLNWCLIQISGCAVEVENTGIRFMTSDKGNNLFINQEEGKFKDEAEEYGVRKGGWGWAASITDFNLDSDLDIIQSNSFNSGNQKGIALSYPSYWEGTKSGFNRIRPEITGLKQGTGRGIARLDYDRDGDMDLIIAERGLNSQKVSFSLYENLATGNYVNIILRNDDKPVNGAELVLNTEKNKQRRIHNSRSDFFSQETQTISFGVESSIRNLTVEWPNGKSDKFKQIDENTTYIISPGEITDMEQEVLEE